MCQFGARQLEVSGELPALDQDPRPGRRHQLGGGVQRFEVSHQSNHLASLAGWQRAAAGIDEADGYQVFSAGGQTIGGMSNKRPTDTIPYWVYHIRVDDIETAVERVQTAGGRIFESPFQMPGRSWIARCGDPQGAAFALQGERNRDTVGWSTEWGGFSSKGKLVKSPP